MSIILNPDKIFKAQAKSAPGMSFEFRQVNKKVGLGNGFRYKNTFSKRTIFFKFNWDLFDLVKIMRLDFVFF